MDPKNILRWLKVHKRRVMIGIVCLLSEFALFFGSGVLRMEETDFLSGEGSYEEPFSRECNLYVQVFRPAHTHLRSVSFLISMDDVTVKDGTLRAWIADRAGNVLYEKQFSYAELANGRFTDMEVDLRVSPFRTYEFALEAEASSAGEYLTVSLCDISQGLPESRKLFEVESGSRSVRAREQLVMRYVYTDAVSNTRLWVAILLCVLTMLGIWVPAPKNPYLQKGLAVVVLLAGPALLGWQMERLTFAEVYALPITMRFRTLDYLPLALPGNLAILYGVEVLLLLVTHSLRISAIGVNVFTTVVYSANYFVLTFRGTPLRVSDLSAARTAAKVMGQYDFTPNAALAIAWGIALTWLLWSCKLPEWKRSFSKRYIACYAASVALAFGLGAGAGYLLLYTDLLERVGFVNEEFKGFYQDMIYYRDGYLIATCMEVKNARIEPIDGYSARRAEQILQQVAAGQNAAQTETMPGEDIPAEDLPVESLPHVILIMNESFADLRVLADLQLTQDNLAFFNSLQDNTVRGYVNVSVLGGGTANTEFEVFTGCTMAFFPVNYYPYQQAVKKPIHTLVSSMHTLGYRTVSMHPEAEGNWNRTNVYRLFGFDESLWKEDFAGEEVIHSGVSDAATFRRIEQIYEEREPGEKLFVFDLTMQNHGGYHGHETPFAVQDTYLNNPIIDEYLSLIQKSDDAFADLVHYFEQVDEKVVICMYGDHHPWVSDEILKGYQISAGEDPLLMMNKYKTPFVIWANYDIAEADGYDISANYLGGLVQRTAGLPLTPFFTFLEQQRETYPIITVNGYVDAEGVYHNWDMDEEVLAEYRILQYNYLYDDDTVKWGY